MTPPRRPLALLRRSLPARLSAAFLALTLTTLLVATAVSYRGAANALRSRLTERLNALADADSADLNDWLARQRAGLEFFARLPVTEHAASTGSRNPAAVTSDSSFASLVARLRSSLISATEVRLLAVPGGRVLASSDPHLVGTFAVDELYYLAGRDSTFVQHIYRSGSTGLPTLTIASPVRGPGGRTVAVVAAHLDLSQMERVLVSPAGEVPIDAYLVTRLREFVSADRFGRADYRRGVHSHAIDLAIDGRSGSALYRDYDGRPVVGVWRWLPEHELALLVEAPQREAFAPAGRLLASALLFGTLGALLLTIGVVGIARRATRPVLAIARAADRVAQGDFDGVAPVESEDEVGQLALTFNVMTRQLRTLYGELNEQVSTTRDALHEARSTRSLLQDVVDNTTAIVVVVGLDDRILLANNRFDALLGPAGGRTVGLPLASTLPALAAAPLLGALAEARDRGIVVERELDLATGAESHVWQAVSFPLRDPSRSVYALGIVATDLTERARLEEERRHQDASVQQAQKLESLGIMAGGIAHDFNNILGAVLGNAEIALSALDDPDEVRGALEQITAASRRASDLTRQMLAYAGKASFRREIVDVRKVLTEMLALVRAGQSKKVEFIVPPMPDALWLEIDVAQLSQVALNLLTNAAEAIGEGVGSVTLRAETSGPPPVTPETPMLPAATTWLRITVQDTGEGMTDEVRRRLFEPFFSTKRSGRGLGLSAVMGIIRSYGGALTIDTGVGRGTRFDVYLPSVAAPPDAQRTSGQVPTMSPRGTVLVIDDEEALRRVCRRALESAGVEVLDAPDGIAGLATFRAHRDEIRVVVLDLTMPGMGGAEVLSLIRAERPDLPVVIASGYDEGDGSGMIPSDAHTRFLQKPFGVKMLLRVVGDLLD